MPPSSYIRPCLPILRTVPPLGDGWLHEGKIAGSRVQVHKDGKNVRVYTRKGYDCAGRLPCFAQMLVGIAARSAVIDGELVVDDGLHGHPEIHTLYESEKDLCIWAFDLLGLNGRDLRPLPLIERKKGLSTLLIRSGLDCLEFTESFVDPTSLLASCERMGLEGIISKRLDAPYASGRCAEWVKVRCSSWREAPRARLARKLHGRSVAQTKRQPAS